VINARERLHNYHFIQHLETEQGFDESGKIYPPHQHEKTILYTIAGSLTLLLDGQDEKTLLPGSEEIIESGQIHSAQVGESGWKYIAAWDPKEAEQFDH